MYTVALNIVVGVLVAVGIISVADMLLSCFSKSKSAVGHYSVVTVTEGVSEPEELLRRSYMSLNRDRWLGRGRLVVVDMGMSEECKYICDTFAKDRPDILLLTPQELAIHITSQSDG